MQHSASDFAQATFRTQVKHSHLHELCSAISSTNAGDNVLRQDGERSQTSAIVVASRTALEGVVVLQSAVSSSSSGCSHGHSGDACESPRRCDVHVSLLWQQAVGCARVAHHGAATTFNVIEHVQSLLHSLNYRGHKQMLLLSHRKQTLQQLLGGTQDVSDKVAQLEGKIYQIYG